MTRNTLLACLLCGGLMGALSASAQSEVMRKEGGKMYFTSKYLTADMKVKPVWVDNHGYSQKRRHLVVYDQAFNVEKDMTLSSRSFKQTQYGVTATVRPTKRTVVGQTDRPTGRAVYLANLGEFETYIKANFGDHYTFYIGHTDKGSYMACWDKNNYSWQDGADSEVRMTKNGMYYDSVKDIIVERREETSLEYDPYAATWVKDADGETYESAEEEYIEPMEFRDNDHECVRADVTYVSQNFFNDDDKYEYIICTYKECPVPNPGGSCRPYNVDFDENIVLKSRTYDKLYTKCFQVVNEDGQRVLDIPLGRDTDLETFALDGKKYVGGIEYVRGEQGGPDTYYYVLYLIDNQGAGISEVARHEVPADARSYNVAGVRVADNAKGIVIKNGVKCLNR